ncbi:hypothetical protein BIW11_01140 [Tropilaelaps mercedesae]|uniref:Zinc finger CCCH domain-containing protein 3 n=1 Tax=Tropilaelaps mercedesae TaxID=418985 RepID=A0A1V9XIY5_9ACAR|nr:hypothetical protein BIW11_01140 [Tropilaelaps mercedesae]
MSHAEVANLNREQLLQRAKQLQSELAQKRTRPSISAEILSSRVTTSGRSGYRLPQPYGAYRPTLAVRTATAPSSTAGAVRQPASSIRHSHNRVFVRKNRLESLSPADSSTPSSVPPGRLSPAGSVVSVSSSVSSVKDALDELPLSAASSSIPSPQSLPTSTCSLPGAGQISPAHTPAPLDELPSWAQPEIRLVIPVGPDPSDESDEDDAMVRAHSEALRRILHPAKDVRHSRVSDRSVVYQSATKLVKHAALQRPPPPATFDLTGQQRQAQIAIENGSASRTDSLAQSNSQRSFVPGVSRKRTPVVDRISSTGRQQQLQVSSTSVTPRLIGGGGSPRKSLRQVSKFKLTTIPNGRASELSSKLSFAKKPTLTHVTSARGIPSAGLSQRLVVKTSPKKSLLQSRFKLTRTTSTDPALRSVRAAVTPKVAATAERVTKRRSVHLQNLLMLRGVPFQTSNGGKVLKRINTSLHRKTGFNVGVAIQQSSRRWKTTRTMVGAVRQTTTSSGVLASASTVNRAVASHLVNRSIFKLNNKKRLQGAGQPSSRSGGEVKHCLFYIRFGKCHKGDACKFIHDPAKVSICTRFLKGTCKSSTCPFSHEVSADRMPLCSYFQRGQCTAQACPYRHSYFRKDVPYCFEFLHSFCTKGEQCTKQHVLVCTDPECSRDPTKCPLRHKQGDAKKNSPEKTTRQRRKRHKKVVLVSKDISKEAWPEFVTLTNDRDVSILSDAADGVEEEDEEVEVKMPTRASSRRLQRFLERRARPVWTDHSEGTGAVRLEPRELAQLPGHRLRQLIKKLRWMRRVPRPVRIPGEFISLVVADDRDDESEPSRRQVGASPRRKPARPTQDSWPDLSDDVVSETEDNVLFELTYGEAMALARRREGSVASDLSVFSYTSPESDYSSDASDLVDGDGATRDQVEEKDWLLEYLYSLEKSPSPPPKAETWDDYGPIFQQWEFRVGSKIREAISSYKRRKKRYAAKADERARGVPVDFGVAARGGVVVRAEDYIPLWTQEEGEILSEDEVEGVDLDVVDMELGSDAEEGQGLCRGSLVGMEEISSGEENLADASEEESADSGRWRLRQVGVHVSGAEVISDVEDISDVEEGEVF